jgi:pimeloyl-ACP methyl ester carboxylesterase
MIQDAGHTCALQQPAAFAAAVDKLMARTTG